MKPKEHFHGSDLEKIEAVYGIKKEDIISFSCQCKSARRFFPAEGNSDKPH